MKFLTVLLLSLFSTLAFPHAEKEFSLMPYLPIRKHLKDASTLNKTRAPLYAKLTKNKSLVLSYELILMEELALFATNRLDLLALPYLKNGIPLFHEELIDMKETPQFRPRFLDDQFPIERKNIDIGTLKRDWLKHIEDEEYSSILEKARELLDFGALAATNQNCLTRHFVESLARTIWLMDKHYTDSLRLGLKDPRPLSVKFVKIQLKTLNWAYSLDKRAFPLQQEGIPLFCQDVPAIPYK